MPSRSTAETVARLAAVVVALYAFLLSIQLMGDSFKLFGKGFAEALLTTTANPFVGLVIGILATSLVQSSSTTTSIVVGLVGSGALDVAGAVPIIMGANVGTTVTSTLVSVGHMGRRDEFRRAFAGATVHDFFNLLAVAIFLPIEMMTGYLYRAAHGLQDLLGAGGVAGGKLPNPIKAAVKPVAKQIEKGLEGLLPDTGAVVGTVLLVLSLVLLFASLYWIVRLMKSLMLGTVERVFHRVIARNAPTAIFFGMLMTVAVQSSSITTSLMVPLVAVGVVRLEQLFPLTLGANIGTTVTALLASMATDRPEGTTIALCHLVFNLSAVLFVYAVPPLRRLPIRCAEGLAELALRNRAYVLVYVGGTFFLLPAVLVGLHRLLGS